MKNKPFAIIGGMGPQASAYMYNRLIDCTIKVFKVKNNDEFPEILILSVPVPDFISNEENKKKALEMLTDRVKQLNKLEISYLSIACNTAHILLPYLQKVSKKPFVSMIDEVTKTIKKNGVKTEGLLASPTTIRSQLYQQKLEEKNIKTIIPNKTNQTHIEKIIRNIIAGKSQLSDKKKSISIADDLVSKGAKAILLGCTELPLIFPEKYKKPIFNCVDILSISLLHKYYQNN